MADYNPYYTSPGYEVTVKFRIKAQRGTPYSEDILKFAVGNSIMTEGAAQLTEFTLRIGALRYLKWKRLSFNGSN